MVVYSISTIVRHLDQNYWRNCLVVSQGHLPCCTSADDEDVCFLHQAEQPLRAIFSSLRDILYPPTRLWLNGLVSPSSLLFFFLKLCSAIQNKYLTVRQRDQQSKVTYCSIRHSPPPNLL